MLGYEDERKLSRIAEWERAEDPEFVAGLVSGVPHAPKGDCGWPFGLAAVIGIAVLLVGLVIVSSAVATLGAASAVAAAVMHRRYLHGAHSRSRRGW